MLPRRFGAPLSTAPRMLLLIHMMGSFQCIETCSANGCEREPLGWGKREHWRCAIVHAPLQELGEKLITSIASNIRRCEGKRICAFSFSVLLGPCVCIYAKAYKVTNSVALTEFRELSRRGYKPLIIANNGHTFMQGRAFVFISAPVWLQF